MLLALPLCPEIMDVIYILLSISILIALGFLVAFIWSVKKGQYDDTTGPSIRILYDDKSMSNFINTSHHQTQNLNNYGTEQQQNGNI